MGFSSLFFSAGRGYLINNGHPSTRPLLLSKGPYFLAPPTCNIPGPSFTRLGLNRPARCGFSRRNCTQHFQTFEPGQTLNFHVSLNSFNVSQQLYNWIQLTKHNLILLRMVILQPTLHRVVHCLQTPHWILWATHGGSLFCVRRPWYSSVNGLLLFCFPVSPFNC
jgi:hypothetical protein